MTKLATMGTFSCATISISGFKDSDKEANEAYINKSAKNPKMKDDRSSLTVNQFYEEILYPTEQALGETKEYPLQELMEKIDKGSMSGKLICAVLNASSQMLPYWPEQLAKHGFTLVDVTNNSIGSDNYLYIRNNNRTTESPLHEENTDA